MSQPSEVSEPQREARSTRSRLSLGVLIAMAAIGIALCALVVSPFVPGLVWALSLAVVAWPLHRRISTWITKPSIAAGVSTLVVALLLLVPALLMAWHVGSQAGELLQQAQQYIQSGTLRQWLERFPPAAEMYRAASGESGTSSPAASDVVQPVGQLAQAWLVAAAAAAVQVAIALFTLFFLFRDRTAALKTLHSLLPMSASEANYFLEQIRSMTHATIYGTLVVSGIQGGLGGLMFAFIGIPGALMWGVAMAVLSIIPSAGAFLIWLPTAVVLAVQGHMVKAAILGLWGALAVSTIDNFLYPVLVGKEVRLHTLPVFLAVIGGIVVFGAAGIVLGPIVLAGTIALLNVLAGRLRARKPIPA